MLASKIMLLEPQVLLELQVHLVLRLALESQVLLELALEAQLLELRFP